MIRSIFYSGATNLIKSLSNSKEDKITILNYHRINNNNDPFFPALGIKHFTEQIRYISERCTVLSLKEAVEKLSLRQSCPSGVVVTIDDSFKDTYTNAYPILKQFKIPVTVFLATGFVGESNFPWQSELAYSFKKTQQSVLSFNYSEYYLEFPLTNLLGRLKAHQVVKNALKRIPDDDRKIILKALREKLMMKDFSELEQENLSWEQVREMSESGISFGAHTHNHPILTRISEEQVWKEIFLSKTLIESMIDEEVDTFAYPNGEVGEFNKDIERMLKAMGFICACTNIEGYNDKHTDLFELKRMYTSEVSIARFAFRVSGITLRAAGMK
jgi:peptidoglycan/xylan/chitin deacetylase (PgdA/CDA1 family)